MLKRESNQNWMKARVCHSLPGRLRLTATGLRYLPDEGRALAETLVRFGGMRRVRVNTAVESVLLEYDPERLDAQAAWPVLCTMGRPLAPHAKPAHPPGRTPACR